LGNNAIHLFVSVQDFLNGKRSYGSEEKEQVLMKNQEESKASAKEAGPST